MVSVGGHQGWSGLKAGLALKNELAQGSTLAQV